MCETNIEKYKKEIEFIKSNYQCTKSDLVIAEEIDLFMKAIQWYEYDFDKHILAVADVVVNSQNVGNDGLTPKARQIMGVPKLRVL